MKMATNSKKVLYIGRIGLPNNAPSIRVYNNSCILHDLGYDVDVLCLKESDTDCTIISYSGWLRYLFTSSKNHAKLNFIQKIGNLIEPIFNIKAKKKIKLQLSVSKPDIIITYNDLLFSSIFLNKYCKRKGIKLISDVTEWYEKRPLQKNIANYLIPVLTDYRIRCVDKKIGNIIAISPYLRDYYLSEKCNVLFLPPVFDKSTTGTIEKHNYYDYHVVNFIYAGSPGSKDILLPFIKVVSQINEHVIKIRLDILGVDASYVSAINNSILATESRGIFFHGKVKHDIVLDFLKNADFTVLLRNNQRYAKAGFSTKLAESMLAGVAIFANKVGGAETLIENNLDGIVIDSPSEQDIRQGLYQILNMPETRLVTMRNKAKEKASSFFVRERYIDKFQDFIDQV